MIALKLIVTGSLERKHLGTAISRVFPDRLEVQSIKLDAFTTARLDPSIPPPEDAPVMKLAAELVASVEPGRARKSETPPDLVMVIEDLELANWDQPGVVVECFRRAVEAHVTRMEAASWGARTAERVRERLMSTCSFHLFVPMIESYFLKDSAALQAHLHGQRASAVDPACDVESLAFTVTDKEYADPADPGRRHPKRYLNFLCDPRAPELRSKRAYAETKQGAAILQALSWEVVLSQPEQPRYLRALFSDLAWAIGDSTGDHLDPPFPGEGAPETKHKDEGVLRNL